MLNSDTIKAIARLLALAEPALSESTVLELKLMASNLQAEQDIAAAKLHEKQKACIHKNARCIGVHPHRGEELMKCPDCGLEWWD